MSGLINKAKDALSSDKHHDTYSTTASTNAGPHSSNVANKADPRVDSDLDHRNNPAGTMGISNAGYGTATTGTTHGSTNAGPHSSNVMNKADPRVDSDRDYRANPTSHTTGTGFTGTTGSSATGITPGSGTAKDTAGPHNSNMLNKLDPRVDSDLDGSKTMGGNVTTK